MGKAQAELTRRRAARTEVLSLVLNKGEETNTMTREGWGGTKRRALTNRSNVHRGTINKGEETKTKSTITIVQR